MQTASQMHLSMKTFQRKRGQSGISFMSSLEIPKLWLLVSSVIILRVLLFTYEMMTGRVGHQKRIRKLLRLISFSSGIHVAVWEECYWRWRALSETIFESLNESPDGGERPPPAQVRLFRLSDLVCDYSWFARIFGSNGKISLCS